MATIFEISATSHRFFIKLLFILFIISAVAISAADPASNPSTKMATDTLFSDVSSASSKTAEFHPRKKENAKQPKARKDEFVAGDKHEVPSGPNPISN